MCLWLWGRGCGFSAMKLQHIMWRMDSSSWKWTGCWGSNPWPSHWILTF
jgi:hypothetical protein